MKRYIQSLKKGSEADQYVVQNLTWSGVYLMITLSNTIFKKILTLVPLTAKGPEVFDVTMTTFISYCYYSLEETLTHMRSLKLKSCPGDNVTDLYVEILVDAEGIDSYGSFKPEHLGYITCIFEDIYDYRFCLWGIKKYKEVT